METEEFLDLFLNVINNPKIRINDQVISDSIINRTTPESLYPSMIGEVIGDKIG